MSVEGVTKSFLPPAPFTKKMLLTTDHKFQELDNISHMNKRAKHFSICVDNVFEDPDLIRKWALTLDYTSHPQGHWPGKRSTNFQDIEPELNRQFIFKVLGLHGTNLWSRWEASLVTFHKIKRFSDNKDSIKNEGWVHTDEDDKNTIAGVVYLTPNIDIDSGTSLFNFKPDVPKEVEAKFWWNKQIEKKNFMVKGGEIDDIDKYEKALKENNDMFFETTRFNNVYNRMLIYDGRQPHRANSFYHEGEERLSLIYFIHNLEVTDRDKKVVSPLSFIRSNDTFEKMVTILA